MCIGNEKIQANKMLSSKHLQVFYQLRFHGLYNTLNGKGFIDLAVFFLQGTHSHPHAPHITAFGHASFPSYPGTQGTPHPSPADVLSFTVHDAQQLLLASEPDSLNLSLVPLSDTPRLVSCATWLGAQGQHSLVNFRHQTVVMFGLVSAQNQCA